MIARLLQGIALLAALFLGGCALEPGAPLPEPVLAGEAQVTLLQTSDLHHVANGAGPVGAGAPGSPGGYARIAAYVEQVRRRAGHPVLLVDSGDWSMGTCYDLTLGRQPLALLFQDALRYDCATLGNHEFDYGPAGLARILEAAQASFGWATPLVASNLQGNGCAALAPWLGPGRRIPPTHVKTLANGLRVGFLGLMGRDAAGAAPAAAPVGFLDFGQDAAPVQALVDDLRENQHCHLVIALSHSGTDATGQAGEDVDLASRVRGIDVIASGHTHNPLPRAVRVARGSWVTWILSAGAYGEHVARLDLAYHPGTGSTTLLGSESPAMTDAGLTEVQPGLVADPAFGFLVGSADGGLQAALGDVFRRWTGWADYDPRAPVTGLYHAVGGADPDLRPNGRDPLPGPNGLGNLCADAARAVPNLRLAEALQAGAGGFDGNPFEASLVATGELRSGFPAGRTITFADAYNVLPLGASPDPEAPLPVGYPLVSAYFTVEDLAGLCAFQLAAQTGLIPPDFYPNLSGLSYSLKGPERAAFFTWATAIAVQAEIAGRGAAGSPAAQAALTALAGLATDAGAGLLALQGAGNGFANALVNLDAADPDPEQRRANLAVLGQVQAAAGESAALGRLLMSRARAAVGEVAAFDPRDSACLGPATILNPAVRHRLAASLYALAMVAGVRSRFGFELTPYRAPLGPEILDPADLPGVLANRVDLDPGGERLVETKEWAALLLSLSTPPAQGGHFQAGRITAEYAGSPGPAPVAGAGAAVRTRAAAYPSAELTRLLATLTTLRALP